jgi:hypothetical protein
MMNKTKLLSTLAALAASAPQIGSGSPSAPQASAQWSSRLFSESDLPCKPPETPAVFDLRRIKSTDNAYLLMSASHLAYRFWPGRRERILRQWGFTHFQVFDDPDTSTNGFWAEHGDFILTVFRGTQEPTDLFTDVNVDLDVPPPDWQTKGRVHRGFLNASLSVQKHLLMAAEYARKVGKPHVIAGHSLGGAVAVLSALALEKKNFSVHSVWSFGAPKTGDSEITSSIQKILNAKWHSLNHPADPIPQLPFAHSEKDKLQALANNYGAWIPLLGKLAENASYDSAGTSAAAAAHSIPVTKRPLGDIARGFWKHLPRSYVCELSNRKLSFN